MHDMKQLAKDAERVESSAKAWLSECEGLDRDEVEYHEAVHRLAAFACDLTDETPVDEAWLESLRIFHCGQEAYWVNSEVHWADGYVKFLNIHERNTRGRVRAFALAMGLQLREGEG